MITCDDKYLKTVELSSILLPCIDSILLLFALQHDKQLIVVKIIQNYFSNYNNEDFAEYLNNELSIVELTLIIPEANQTLSNEILTIKGLLAEFMLMNRHIIISDIFKGFAEELNDKITQLSDQQQKITKLISENISAEQLYVDNLRKVFNQQEEIAILLDSIITQDIRHITIINNIYSLHRELLNNTQLVIENILYDEASCFPLKQIANLRNINNTNNKQVVDSLNKIVVLPAPISDLLNWVINTQFMLNNLSLNKHTIKSFLNLEKEILKSLRSIYPVGQGTKDYHLQYIIVLQEGIIRLLENNNQLFEQDKLIIYENHLNIKYTIEGLVNVSITRDFMSSLQNKQQTIRSLLSIGHMQDIYELVQAVKYLRTPNEEKPKLLENYLNHVHDVGKQIIHTMSSIEYDNRINRVNNTEANNHILIKRGILRDVTELELLNYEIINTLTYYNTDDYIERIKKLFYIARHYYPDTKTGILEVANVGYERITDLLNEKIINLIANRRIKISDINYIHHSEVEKFVNLIIEIISNNRYEILDLLLIADCKQSIEIYKSTHIINAEKIIQIDIIQSIINLDYLAMVKYHRQDKKLTNSQIELLLILKYALGEADYELFDIMQFIVSDKIQDARSILDVALRNKYTSIISYIMKANMNAYQYQSIFELKYLPNVSVDKVNKDVSSFILDLFEENINYILPQHFIPFLSDLSITSSSGKDIITLLTLNDYKLCINSLLPYLVKIDTDSMQLNKILNFAKLHEDYAIVQYVLQHKLGMKLYTYLCEIGDVLEVDEQVPKLSSKISVWLLDILESWSSLIIPERLVKCLSYLDVKNNRGHDIIDIISIGNMNLGRLHQVLNHYLGDDLYTALMSGHFTEKTINSINFKLAHKLWKMYLGNSELFSLVNFAICIKNFDNFIVENNNTFLDIVIQQCNFDEIIAILGYKPEFKLLGTILIDNNIGDSISFNEGALVCSKSLNDNVLSFLFANSRLNNTNILIQNTDNGEFFNIKQKNLGFNILLKYKKVISTSAMKFLLPNDNKLFLDWVRQACDNDNKELINLLFLAHEDVVAATIISGNQKLVNGYKSDGYCLTESIIALLCQRKFLDNNIFNLSLMLPFMKDFNMLADNGYSIATNIICSKYSCDKDVITQVFNSANQQQAKLPSDLRPFFKLAGDNLNLLNALLELNLDHLVTDNIFLQDLLVNYNNQCLDLLLNSKLIDLNQPYFGYNHIIEFALQNGHINIIKSLIKLDNLNVNMQIHDVPLAFFLLNAGYFEILPNLLANPKLNINIINKYSESLLSNVVNLLFGEYIISKVELINIFCNINNIAMGQGVNDAGLDVKILDALFSHSELDTNIYMVYYNQTIPLIHYAMYSNNNQLMEVLLRHPMTNIYQLDALGNDFVFSAFAGDNVELIKQILYSTHFKLYYTNTQGELLVNQYLKQLNQNYLSTILSDIINDLEQDIGFNNIAVVGALFDNLMKMPNIGDAQELAIKLLDKATQIDINQIMISGQPILFELIKHDNQIGFIKSILDKGIDLKILDNKGKSLLHYAVDYKNFMALDYLVKYADEHKINIYDLKLEIANYILQSDIYETYSYLCKLNLANKDMDDITFLKGKAIDCSDNIKDIEQDNDAGVTIGNEFKVGTLLTPHLSETNSAYSSFCVTNSGFVEYNRSLDFSLDPFDQDNILSNVINNADSEFSPF